MNDARLNSPTPIVSARKPRETRLADPIPSCTSFPIATGPSSVQPHENVSANRALAASGPTPARSSAQRMKLPLVIHTRSASEDTLRLLKEEGAGQPDSGIGGVFHCFTETMDVARAALDLGFYISFSGIVSFRNAADLREVARFVPLERCLIETDSPYLAPVPYRGKTNSPAYVPHVAAVVAAEKGLTVEAIAEATTRNFERLFQVSV